MYKPYVDAIKHLTKPAMSFSFQTLILLEIILMSARMCKLKYKGMDGRVVISKIPKHHASELFA